MNILIVGNGFDLAHGLPTKYADFLKFIDFFYKHKAQESSGLELIAGEDINCYKYFTDLFNSKQDSEFDQYLYDQSRKTIHELSDLCKDNAWIKYFSEVYKSREQKGKDGWIDFESEISLIIQTFNSVVKKHELTREDKEQDRIHHVDSCNANTGPIFLACRYPDSLLTLMNNWKDHHEAAYDFTEEDQITHRVWVIDEDEVISEINKEFAGIDSLYIADGHHRAASAVKVGLKRREQNPGYTGEEEFNYFLSVVFPYDQLCILPYNRIVKDLNGLTVKAFLGALKFNFELMLMPGFPCKPVEKHCMGMYVDGQWYHLKAWPDIYEKKDVVGQLDVSILQEKVLRPVLGIEDPRTDQRISFVGGSHKAAELAEIADRTGGVAFVMYPTSMEDLMKIADENKLMPPKSTWFEPKLRSGLFIHKL